MAKNNLDVFNTLDTFNSPVQCFNDLIQAYTEYLKIKEQEQTKRDEIEAWRQVTLAEIKAKRDFLIGYLDRSFDEREKNFELLFQTVDQAMSSGNNEELALTLDAIVKLAQSSPFKDLADVNTVRALLDDPDHVWEF